jgi:hypothetical protein
LICSRSLFSIIGVIRFRSEFSNAFQTRKDKYNGQNVASSK